MGLFSNTYKTQVGTAVARVIEDDRVPNSAKTGILTALFGDGQLVEHILEGLTTSIGVRAEKMYKFGQTDYIYGLPSATLVSSNTDAAVVWEVVLTQVGALASQEYYHFGALNRQHVGWLKLVNDHGYDSSTNQLGLLTIEKGSPVYLKDMVVVVQDSTVSELENGSLDQWGMSPKAGETPERVASTSYQLPHSPFGIDVTATEDYVRVTYVWNVPTEVTVNGIVLIRQVPTEGSFIIPITGYPDADYFQVAYTLDGKRGYWLYRVGEDTVPEIEAIYSPSHDGLGSFFPFGYFRYDKVAMDADPLSAGYLSSEKLFKKLGLDYPSLVESVHANPDIDDVEQAMMMMAVPANTENPLERRYLFEFFSKFYLEAGGIGMTPTRSMAALEVLAVTDEAKPQISMIIQDARFKMSISCLGMSRRKVAGNVGAVGSYTSGMITEIVLRTGLSGYSTTEGPDLTPFTWEVPVSRHYYRHQISDAVYEEVQVIGMKVSYHILGDYKTIGDELDSILLIPIDRSITENYNIPEKELLYSRSLHYVFNSVVQVKVAWYQTGLFKFLMVVAAVVITVFTNGASIELLATTLATASAATIAIMIGTGLLKMFIAGLLAKVFVKAVGVKAAMIVAIIAAVAGLSYAFDAGSIAGAPWAEQLLALSSNLMSGVQSMYGDMIQELQKDALSFGSFVKDKIEELEAAQSLLEQRTMLSPFVIFGETPDEFYNRTVHSGNIGVIGLDAISSYVDVSLTLPKFHQTM